MPQSMRSIAQSSRHAYAKQNLADRRILVAALIKQKAALEDALKEVKAALKAVRED